jgi:hypothetical protein
MIRRALTAAFTGKMALGNRTIREDKERATRLNFNPPKSV